MAKIEKVNEARAFLMAAQHLLPLVEEWRQRSSEELRAALRSGLKEDLIMRVARYDAFSTIMDEIQHKQLEYEHIMDKQHKE